MTLVSVGPIVWFQLSKIKLNAIELRSLVRIAACSCSLVILTIILSYLLSLQAPRSVPLIFGAVFFLGAVGVRMIGLTFIDYMKGAFGNLTPVAIYGAGAAGVQLATVLRQDGGLRPVLFLDDNPALHGLIIAGIKVRSPRDLEKFVSRGGIEKLLIAMPSVSRLRRNEIVKGFIDIPIEIRITPSFTELLSGEANSFDLKPVSPDDLLGRDKVDLDVPDIAKTYAGRVVMVTGAGGSIGSEFCRQLLECEPAKLVLFELSEFALYSIDQAIRSLAPEGKFEVESYLGSICDRARIDQIIRDEGVDVILHAAAYKHVPLLENNVLEAVRNNVFGSKTVAEASLAANIERFVLVSSDKAVRPTSVMGATKRLAEIIVQDLQVRSHSTKFAMVRFGNVLGSSGSVLPLFRDQITKGGPVTVTHPEMTRYFMTIDEAARLILLAGAYVEGGDVFLLDMGEPVRIVDLARRMIEMSGCRPVELAGRKDQTTLEVDEIGIRIVGTRPGEKLYEEMLIDDANTVKTPHDKIVRANESSLKSGEVETLLMQLEYQLANMDSDGILKSIGPLLHSELSSAHWARQTGDRSFV
ncbi:MAG: nucleoside-diphosphate sugar epimerase/dehydratase [Rhizobiaceae bacterium]